jgi:hypothetical protein
MQRVLTTATVLLCVALAACASNPSDGPPAPGPAGTSQSAAPETGNVRGLTSPVTVNSREKADVATDYRSESGQAGAVTNWQGLGNLASGVVGAPPGFRACARAMEVLATRMSDPACTKAQRDEANDRIVTLASMMHEQYGEYVDRMGPLVAPRIEKVIVINNAGVGSANGSEDPITEKKVEAGSKAIAEQTNAGMGAFKELVSPSAEQLEAAEARARKAEADAEAARKALELAQAPLTGAGAAADPLGPPPAGALPPVADTPTPATGDPK